MERIKYQKQYVETQTVLVKIILEIGTCVNSQQKILIYFLKPKNSVY